MNRFVIADLHLGHKNILEFEPARKRLFADIDQMHEQIIVNWNSIVRKEDQVYVLGDVAFNKKFLPLLNLMNGKKVLIKGNHDIFGIEHYLPYFKDIRAYHVINRIIMSHIPVHESQKERYILNIHGHLHNKSLSDPFYKCVSVEQTNFTPLNLDCFYCTPT